MYFFEHVIGVLVIYYNNNGFEYNKKFSIRILSNYKNNFLNIHLYVSLFIILKDSKFIYYTTFQYLVSKQQYVLIILKICHNITYSKWEEYRDTNACASLKRCSLTKLKTIFATSYKNLNSVN